MQGITHVIICAAPTWYEANDKKVLTTSTRAIFNSAVKAQVKRVIYTSSYETIY